MVRTLHFQGHGFDPWLTPQATWRSQRKEKKKKKGNEEEVLYHLFVCYHQPVMHSLTSLLTSPWSLFSFLLTRISLSRTPHFHITV